MSIVKSASAGRSAAPRHASAAGNASIAASASIAGLSASTTPSDLPLFSRLELPDNQDVATATSLLRRALREFGAGADP